MRTPPTIDREALAIVSGGASRAKQDERILDKIQSLAGAVSDVAAQQQNQPNPSASVMPLIAMKMMRRT